MSKEKLNLIESFGLQVEKVEDRVYKVLNSEIRVDIQDLLESLGKGTLIISNMNSHTNGIINIGDIATMSRRVCGVYYIFLDYNIDRVVIDKYQSSIEDNTSAYGLKLKNKVSET